jgi:hypothetical protein
MTQRGDVNPRCLACQHVTVCARCHVEKHDSEYSYYSCICLECCPQRQTKYALDRTAAVHTLTTTSDDIDLSEYLTEQRPAIVEHLDSALAEHKYVNPIKSLFQKSFIVGSFFISFAYFCLFKILFCSLLTLLPCRFYGYIYLILIFFVNQSLSVTYLFHF